MVQCIKESLHWVISNYDFYRRLYYDAGSIRLNVSVQVPVDCTTLASAAQPRRQTFLRLRRESGTQGENFYSILKVPKHVVAPVDLVA